MCIGSYADISIYVPTRGAIYIYAHHLNSTLISIHAPTRGATIFRATWRKLNRNFNPRSHERSDKARSYITSRLFLFQSTLPREERRRYRRIRVVLNIFQSTLPREERPSAPFSSSPIWQISIHAPTRGATHASISLSSCGDISIHAPTRGATYKYAVDIGILSFQSTLPREERRFWIICRTSLVYFNPRSHERSDVSRC